MDKTMLETLLVYHGENGAVFKSDVVLAMIMPHLNKDGQNIVKTALEIKAEVDKQKANESTNSKSYS